MRTTLAFAIGGVLLAASAFAQAPDVINGTLQTHASTQGLSRELSTLIGSIAQPAWIGYVVKTRPRDGDDGCWSDGINRRRSRTAVKLEGSDALYVLYRVDAKRVDRIKIASSECQLDAGGFVVHWLTGVSSNESLDYLTTFTEGKETRRLANEAIVAIALHADPAASDRLLTLARRSQDSRVRADALFWVGQRAGEKAVGTITDALDNDPDTEVKKRAVFALSRLPKDEGVPKLIDVARKNRNPEVRRQAMFWLGQSNDPRALAFFEEVLRP
jgi:HEAT repeat protein